MLVNDVKFSSFSYNFNYFCPRFKLITMNNYATVEQAVELGLIEDEYHKICDILKRKPNFTELSIYSVMWSEHCSYKNSIKWLKTLLRMVHTCWLKPVKKMQV